MSIRPHIIRVSDGTIFDIDGEMTIGRKSSCDITLDTEDGISRVHARLVAANDVFLLSDLGSTNGTMINGTVIDQETELRDGDVLQFSTLEYRVVLPDSEAATVELDDDDDRTILRSDAPTQLAPNSPAAAPPAPVPPPAAQPASPAPGGADRGAGPKFFQEVAGEHTVIAGRQIDPDLLTATDPGSFSHPVLLVRSGNSKGTTLSLDSTGDQVWSVGTAAGSSLVLSDSGVSARHAQITREKKTWKLVDQMSINGTFVNGEQVNLRYVNSGDFLRFGPVDCELIIPKGRGRKRASGNKGKSSGGSSGSGALKWWIVGALLVLILVGAGVFAWMQGMLDNFI